MIEPETLRAGGVYFHVNYCDRTLRVPVILTLSFIREEPGAWLFQRADEFLAETDAGMVSLTTLAALFDWAGLVSELNRNWEAQQKGEPFD